MAGWDLSRLLQGRENGRQALCSGRARYRCPSGCGFHAFQHVGSIVLDAAYRGDHFDKELLPLKLKSCLSCVLWAVRYMSNLWHYRIQLRFFSAHQTSAMDRRASKRRPELLEAHREHTLVSVCLSSSGCKPWLRSAFPFLLSWPGRDQRGATKPY